MRSEKIAGNRLRWTVTLDDPRTTVSTLLAQATLPPPEAGRVAAPSVTFEQPAAAEKGPQFQALDQQHHYLVLVNQSLDGYTVMAVTNEAGPDGSQAPTQQPQLYGNVT